MEQDTSFDIWHIAIPVDDLDKSTDFYCKQLGFKLIGYDEYPSKKQAFIVTKENGMRAPTSYGLSIYSGRCKIADDKDEKYKSESYDLLFHGVMVSIVDQFKIQPLKNVVGTIQVPTDN